jgi:ABC-type branched-subunit amino acid transport system ATPase component
MTLLELHDVTVRYGGVRALDRVSFDVVEGRILGLIGPNGAGKTTLIDSLTGMAPYKGHIRYAGRNIDRWAPHRRSKAGIVRTFQSVELFRDLSVRDNMLVYADAHGWANARPGRGSAGVADRVEEALDFFGVHWTLHQRPQDLPHGTRRLVSIARALSAQPRLLLLDEPAAGLEVGETRQLGDRLRALTNRGRTTILLVDHDMDLVFGHCDDVQVLTFGTWLASGTPAEIRENPLVRSAYLGAGAQDGSGGGAS